ncbi:3-phosphoshikimate 1-carboxyvinyltransferase [Haladaptatus sp. F3-133]|jgi:3-phosphoshikimate 1-carboxyvinyltransferase|uniref:3-phosphoshikimate 1-carboxyvinyltransferase n=1 Tax=Halorutilus salinus TaxID=2487751 RepID=A0A9Q4C3Y6_9EURY|nr:3-phosphoshikimate 1-carboxyvinyltransferase [Halorutilus salinus]MCX2818818.1 3-phosphoshikimate 1-carboxyvinyltransferase [Halorutilus salinus]
MELVVSRSHVSGRVEAPPSKSYSHRGILAGALGDGTRVLNPLRSADTEASIRCARGLGGSVDEDGDDLVIDGVDGAPETPDDVLNCGNSGTTTRLFAGAASLVDGLSVLTGDESLRSRPNAPLLSSLRELGATARSTRGNGRAPLVVGDSVEGGKTTVDGTVSSQFISSLLFTAPLTDGVTVKVDGTLKSRPYVDITVEVLEETGIDVRETETGFEVPGNQRYTADEFRVPGDFSSASYPLAAGALAGETTVGNLFPSAQGDAVILDVLERMGASVDRNPDDGVARVKGDADELTGVTFDASDSPDLTPTVAALGSAAGGETRIVDAEHVRYKETDRLEAMATELRKMGAVIEEERDRLVIDGNASELVGTRVDGRDDHRVVMALAVAALVAEGETSITTAETVGVSYPGFVDDLSAVGADVETV